MGRKKKSGGPKPLALAEKLDNRLRELYVSSGVTITHAAEIVSKEFGQDCSDDYVGRMFNAFAKEIDMQKELVGQSWLERIDAARDRALEGYSRTIQDSKQRLVKLEDEVAKIKALRDAMTDEAFEAVKESKLGQQIISIIGSIEPKDLFTIITLLRDKLGLNATYTQLVLYALREVRAERTFIAEQQQQFDGLEMMPPLQQVLNLEIEKYIAAKQNLYPVAVEDQQKHKEKGK